MPKRSTAKQNQSAEKSQNLGDYEVNEIEQALRVQVDEIWRKYDEDGNGTLDHDEMRVYMQDMMLQMGSLENFDEAEFDLVFEGFDTDGDGTISKEEMRDFLRKVSDLWMIFHSL